MSQSRLNVFTTVKQPGKKEIKQKHSLCIDFRIPFYKDTESDKCELHNLLSLHKLQKKNQQLLQVVKRTKNTSKKKPKQQNKTAEDVNTNRT